MNRDQIEELLKAWGDLDGAFQDVETALPQQMSERIHKATTQRIAFRSQFQGLLIDMLRGPVGPEKR